MKIAVFDVPAENGGALTILEQYYNDAVSDKENEWIFIVSTPNFKEYSNVKVFRFPWVKKSWLHRLYFDNFVAPKIVKKIQTSEIISLQNVIVKCHNIKQTLYIHQPLPFIEKKFGILENPRFWVYQNIISKEIFVSIKMADMVIVQTHWMKEAIIKKTKVSEDKVAIIPPKVDVAVGEYYKENNDNIFFYPASGLTYKNHSIIVGASKMLLERGINNYKIVFTLTGKENRNIETLYNDCLMCNLPVQFVGILSKEKVYEYYCKSTLIFPSYIETYGLPLLEAKVHRCPIIASDCAFSHEILQDYSRAKYFNPFDTNRLVYILAKFINQGNGINVKRGNI